MNSIEIVRCVSRDELQSDGKKLWPDSDKLCDKLWPDSDKLCDKLWPDSDKLCDKLWPD